MLTYITNKVLGYALIGLIITVVCVWYVYTNVYRAPLLDIYVFDTPGSQSLFIRTPDDKRILIDGGSNATIIRNITEVLPFYSRRIDIIVNTYPDGKHVGGLIDVLNRYDVGQIIQPKNVWQSPKQESVKDGVYETFRKTLEEKRLPIKSISAFDHSEIGSRVYLNIIFPVDKNDFSYSNASSPELLFTITYASTSILFAGQASPKVQKYIASKTSNSIHVDSIIFSHSLAVSRTSPELIRKINPSTIVYSENAKKKSNSSTGANNKKSIELKSLLSNRALLNVKEKGSIHLVSNGMIMNVAQK